jgi:predicted ATPase/class 3 adenylate cyclase
MVKPDWTHQAEHASIYIEPLTRREREILILLDGDHTHKEIADYLTLAPSSVKWYVQQVYRKLGVNSRRQAIVRGKELGWLAATAQQERPSGYVTFLFTDIEGSTRLWETAPQAMQQSFRKQETILRQVFARYGGYVYKMVGDAFQVAFASASQAVEAAIEAQRELVRETWGEAPLRIRMGLHTCFTEERGDDYVGPELNRVARLLSCGHGGQVLLTQAAHQVLGGLLPQGAALLDLGQHRLKDIIEPEHIFQITANGLPVDFPALRSQNIRMHNLRPQHIPFVGREDEIAEIVEMLAPENNEVRLLTLIGPGGVGKTRAALQAASSLVDRFTDGVFFVELAAAVSLPGMIEAIASAVNLQLVNSGKEVYSKENAWEQLVDYFSKKELLLILDNFEHLVQFSPVASELISSAARIKLVATSRVRLNVAEEWLYPLEGLPYPQDLSGDNFRRYPAVQLFLDCAKMSGLSKLQEKDMADVARVCQLVEGLPLAIQLAASWVRLYSLQEIANEISQDLDFLQHNQVGVPDRHQTIRAVFEHSWRLLSSAEADAFMRLAVFDGGFTLSAAQSVTQSTNMVISALMDKSLIRRNANGRFIIHEILRQYSIEKLQEYKATLLASTAQHAAYYAGWAEQMGKKLRGAEQASVQSSLRAESQNLRRAWHWLLEHDDYGTIRRTIDSVILLFDIFGSARRGRDFLGPLVENLHRRKESGKPFADDDLLALSLVGLIYFDSYDSENKERFTKESFRIAQNLPVSPIKAYTYLLLMTRPGAYLEWIDEPDLTRFEKLMFFNQETLEIFEESGDQWGIALTLLIRGDLMNSNQQETEIIIPVFQKSLALFTEMGNLWGQALCNHGMAIVLRRQGQYSEALQVNQKAMDIYHQYGNLDRLIPVRHLSAELAETIGDLESARYHYTANRDYFDHTGNQEARSYYQERLDRLAA